MAAKAKRKKVVWSGIAAASAILFFAGISFSMRDRGYKEQSGKNMDYHIVFIADNMEDIFWDEIYKEIKIYGRDHGIYIENLNDVFSEGYTKTDYLEMAALMNVDGMIIQGDQDKQTKNLIDKAEQEGIPTITVLNDCEESNRISYISTSNYDIGCEYGRQILQIEEEQEVEKILVLTSDIMDEAGINLVFSGMRDILNKQGERKDLEISSLNTKNRTIFDTEEYVRQKLISKEETPDVIICMGEQETISISRLIVDYNKVNTTKVLGYYTSKNVLKAIENGSVTATLAINAKDIAEVCIDIFLEYMDKKLVSDYIAIDVSTVTKVNVREYQKNVEKGNSKT